MSAPNARPRIVQASTSTWGRFEYRNAILASGMAQNFLTSRPRGVPHARRETTATSGLSFQSRQGRSCILDVCTVLPLPLPTRREGKPARLVSSDCSNKNKPTNANLGHRDDYFALNGLIWRVKSQKVNKKRAIAENCGFKMAESAGMAVVEPDFRLPLEDGQGVWRARNTARNSAGLRGEKEGIPALALAMLR
jgi:hypothetical protein